MWVGEVETAGSAKVCYNAALCKLAADAIDPQSLQVILGQGKTLGKAIYVFSVDSAGNKVAHGNYLPPALQADGFDARSWATSVSEVIGGKVRHALCESELYTDHSSLLRLVGSPRLPKVSVSILRS